MSMFSFPTEMNMNEMMKPMSAMTDWTKAQEMNVSPLMVYPLGAAAAATAVGFGMAGQMAGMMMGVMQGAMQNQSSLLGAHPDLSWMVPTLAEDLAPEETEQTPVHEKAASVEAKSAEVVELNAAPAPTKVKAAPAKAKAAPAKSKASSSANPTKKTAAKKTTDAAVEKLKSDADVAVAATTETPQAAASATPSSELAPEDYRRPAEMEKPETPDDLKLISGIGPKLEQVLNGLGVFTFSQIAAWKPEEAAWVDDYLQFGGRVERDSWISQAGALAKGGITAQ